ncbi:MAG: hypothetical protein WCG98_09795 [bacterium]
MPVFEKITKADNINNELASLNAEPDYQGFPLLSAKNGTGKTLEFTLATPTTAEYKIDANSASFLSLKDNVLTMTQNTGELIVDFAK